MAANGFWQKNVNVKSASTGGFRMAGCVRNNGGDLHIAAVAAVAESLSEANLLQIMAKNEVPS